MKKSIALIFLAAMIVVAMASISFAHNNSAPNMECYACHNDGPAPAFATVKGLPEKYTPGKTYTVTVSVQSGIKSDGNVQGGFSASVNGGELVVKDKKNTQLVNNFITHTKEGSEKRTWTFLWKAPREKVDVELHVSALAANGDFAPHGDSMGAALVDMSAQ